MLKRHTFWLWTAVVFMITIRGAAKDVPAA